MVRKRNAHTRWRSSRSRPKTPAPKDGFRIAELSHLVQVPVRRVRHYVEIDLLQPLEVRGTATRYPRRALLRLLATLRLRKESQLDLTQIKARLDALGDGELEAWLSTAPLPPLAASALGIATSPPMAASSSSSAPPTRPDFITGRGSSTWQRIALLPGLELMLSAQASPAVRRAAEQIYQDYVAPALVAGGLALEQKSSE